MSRLTAANAYDLVKASQAGKRMVEDKVARAVENCIRSTASQGQTSLLYSVPAYQFGLPIYDVQAVVRRVGGSFARKGFRVKVVGTNHLYMEWGQPKKKPRTAAGPKPAPSQRVVDATRKVRFNLSKLP